MTTELTDIDGVGPSRAEDLEEAGYESAADVADADADELDELLGASVSGENLVSNAQAETTADADSEHFEFEPGFSAAQEHHLMAALVNEEVNARQRNNDDRREAVHEAIDSVRTGEPYQFTLEQLSVAYTATNQIESEYRGTRGLASFVSDVRDVNQFFQSARREHWPDA